MDELVWKASILHEALPYLRRFHGRIFVIKYGGHAMVEPALRESFARDIALMNLIGIHPVVVHGGGPQIDAMLAELGVKSERVDGLRITDDRTMDVVEMVLAGRINKEIVSLMCRHGARAVGLSGRDDFLLMCERIERLRTKRGDEVDPGWVGRVIKVRTELLFELIHGGFIPVIAPIGSDAQGHALNVNADTVAGAIASALKAEKLLLLTDIEGVRDANGQIISSLRANEIQRLIDDGVITGGMIPKVRSALDALSMGVQKCHIIDGRMRHAILLEVFTDRGVGTEILGVEE
ncbi:MAG: acetylglutamate kinase [Deltaproteobacteria bacterium]|nr:acetylglutamate kinase [Deltaproteobacteria bacterium]